MGGRHQQTAQSQKNVYRITPLTISRFIFIIFLKLKTIIFNFLNRGSTEALEPVSQKQFT
jgi:hypothetical protein